jgi:magnesium transporter
MGDDTRSAVVNCVAYAGGRRISDVAIEDISEALKHADRFVWIGLHEPSEDLLRRVQEEFGLHDLAVEDARHAHQRPKIERYDDDLFVVLRTAQINPSQNRIEFGETHIFVGLRYVVSVRHGPSHPYVDVRKRCEATPQLLVQGSGFVLYALMDFVVDQYFPIVATLERQLDALEEQIFGEEFTPETTARIYELRRDLLEVKRAVSPLVDICNRLMRFDLDVIPEDTRPYFRDVYDHVVRINELVDNLRELLSSAFEAQLSLISSKQIEAAQQQSHAMQAQNEAMKQLAAWAAIIAVPTMIAGVYGMNFEFMPELRLRWGYPLIMLAMFGACGFLYYRFKRSGWL